MLIALALTAIGGGSGNGDDGSDSGGAITATAPPHAVEQTAPCTKLLRALPVALKSLAPRVVDTTPATPFVVAWGNPAIVLRCGVDKPKAFNQQSSNQVYSAGAVTGANYWVDGSADSTVYTAIDRQAYVSYTIPSKYQGADYLPILNTATVAAMPKAVCVVTPTATSTENQLCTRRS